MSISIKIQKKDLWLLSAIVIFLVGVGYVVAWGSGNPAVHGHDIGEIEGAVTGAGGGWVTDGTAYTGLSISNTVWYNLDLSSIVGSRETLVLLKVREVGGNRNLCVKPYGDSNTYDCVWGKSGFNQVHNTNANQYSLVMTNTDGNGKVGLLSVGYTAAWDIILVGHVGIGESSGSGSGGNCRWLELPQVECDGSGDCKGKISLQTAENNGYTGACYFQKQDDNGYWGGEMVKETATTSKSTSMLICKRFSEQGTDSRNLDATHKAYYYACTGGGSSGSSIHFPNAQAFNGNSPTSFTDLDLSSIVGANSALVYLKVKNGDSAGSHNYIYFRKNGATEEVDYWEGNGQPGGTTTACINIGRISYFSVQTDSSGKIEWKGIYNYNTIITVENYIK